ncbi:hypothetical protein BO82DRAFT_356998 [Aspergillus uvarum CBS 121591]|uniref:Uncharacterized protein n=1 Tax=Aspergillus uvarum CBS 121591 TaxID=1448315 RepID=A0A319CJH5_9EURO|nr:hypothetical protein BO82DRAFT_356998 [Aspergillus uvarum CBS 121591]PYH78823.1 hypothetical protein BO82DRAFT_356998 [Aspergillus uvarum CBS 121591]
MTLTASICACHRVELAAQLSAVGTREGSMALGETSLYLRIIPVTAAFAVVHNDHGGFHLGEG